MSSPFLQVSEQHVLPPAAMCEPAATPLAGESDGLRIGPDEQLISLTEATKHLPRIDGRKIAISTLWRWCRGGLRGVFLEYVRTGRRICTTRQALLRFFNALAALDQRVAPDQYYKPTFLARRPISSRRRQRALAEADRILAEARI